MKTLNNRIVMVLLSLFIYSASSYAETAYTLVNGFYYILNEATLEATFTSPSVDKTKLYGAESITIPSEVTHNNKTYKVTAIDYATFENDTKLKSITIPSTVSFIGERAFQYCKSLTSVTLPNSLLRIERNTFGGCNSLKKIVIPEGVTTISQYAFDECNALTSVVIPSSVDFISTHAFEKCKALNSITVKSATPIDIFSNTFTVYGDLHVPAGSKAAYEQAPIWKKFNIIEDDEVTGIKDLENANEETVIYSLSGTRLSASGKGVNIVNGKKVVIK